MARLSDDEVSKLKTDISLLRLVESQGYATKKQGADYVLSCPFHEEGTPSLVISPKNNLFHCFGCEAAGSVIDWVMKTRGVSFRFACEILMEDAGLVAEGSKPVARNTTTKLATPLAANADKQTALNGVLDYYHQTLKQSPEALEYLQGRGLNHPELIDTFKLGYANRTLGYRLPEKNRKEGKELRGQLQEIGLLRNTGHEHFNGSLIVPVIMPRDGRYVSAPGGSALTYENGLISEVYGRKVRQDLRKGTPLHLYLPGQHEGVWNITALAACEEVILCEALIDAMTFWCAGFRNVTASYGTSGFTDDHLAAFKANKVKRVLIAYDRDEAGNNAAQKLTTLLTENGFDVFRIVLPKDVDVNEYALQMPPAAKSLGQLIRKAEWLGNGKAPKITTQGMEGEPVVHPEIIPALAAEELPEPSTATPLPEAPKTVDAKVDDREVNITLGGEPQPPASGSHKAIHGQNRHYRVRGLQKNLSYDQLKVNLLVTQDERVHVDTFDLYASRPRQAFINQASVELGVQDEVIKTDLGKVLLKLEELQEVQIKQTLEPKKETVNLSDTEQQQALELLKDPALLSRILLDFETAGVVGEETNKLMGYLACVSRKLDKPLAVIIQSSSAAGKSSLMDAVLAMMPEEERVQYSAMTGQSLFYMGETNLKHKILAIAEEEGADTASYALKLLQSEGELTIASTGKDESSGNLVTKEYHVEGPVMLFLTTTAIDIDEELMNRCLVLTVNESREQTQAIHAMQRQQQTLEGLLRNEDKKQIIELHRNAQRLLRPLLVANPFAEQLTFIDDKTRTRRDHMKYLTLIRAIALLHQYQREVKRVNHHGEVLSYIEVEKRDIEVANKLAHDVLGRSLDELPPQTRTLLKHIQGMVKTQCKSDSIEQNQTRFSRKDIRHHTGWTDFQVRTHLGRLVELEYVLTHRGGRGQSFVYELLYNGEVEDNEPFLSGLIDVESLKYGYGKKNEGQKENNEVSLSTHRAANKPPLSSDKKAATLELTTDCEDDGLEATKKGIPPIKNGHDRNHTPLVAQ